MGTIEELMGTKDQELGIEESVESEEPSGEEEPPSPGEEGEETEEDSPDVEEAVEEQPPPADDPVGKRLDELEKANKGLLGELTKERSKRQNLEGRFSQINEFLSTVEQQRRQGVEPSATTQKVIDALKVEFDEDESPIIKIDNIKEIIKKELAPLQSEILSNRQQQLQQQQASSIGSMAQRVIEEDPAFRKGMQELTNQWTWISNNFDEYVRAGNNPPQNQRNAIEMLYSSGVAAEFEKQYPASDFDMVVDAFMTNIPTTMTRKLRKALKMVSKKEEPVLARNKGSLAQAKMLGKKSNFSNAPNNKKAGVDLNSIADLPLETLLSLSESQAEKLYSLMEEE